MSSSALLFARRWYIKKRRDDKPIGKGDTDMKKTRDLLAILGIYLLAFLVGALLCRRINGIMLRLFVFDAAATVVVFVFSVLLHNSSVYDAYWSVAPGIMAIWLFAAKRAFSAMHFVFLAVFLVWAVRLTVNWIEVFTDFSYEDWRYRKYREESPRLFWPVVNFFGIHMMPTLVVFAGMLPLFELTKQPLNAAALPGIAVMAFGILMEFFADRQMHAFLSSENRGTVCQLGLWNYSRHPNYLGEISFWCGVYLAMLPASPSHWYYGVGCAAVALLFNVVSVPLMEKRQLSRRPVYREYRATTSRLLLLPKKRRGHV